MAFSNTDAWIAQVSGFALDKVESVTFFVHDAAKHRHSIGPITAAPFTAQLEWWTWDDAGQTVVTSHVEMQAGGNVVKDPGGWTTVDGQSVNPGGHLETMANADGSFGARYTPDRAASRIGRCSSGCGLAASGTRSPRSRSPVRLARSRRCRSLAPPPTAGSPTTRP